MRIFSLSHVLVGEGRGEGDFEHYRLSTFRITLTLTLSHEYVGEGTRQSDRVAASTLRTLVKGGELSSLIRSGDSATIRLTMALSARNQFIGKVVSVRSGSVMSEVVIDIGGGHKIVSLISTSSAKRLKLKKGARAVAVIKSTEVIVSTDTTSEA
jgi:molybdopterin-binding protein